MNKQISSVLAQGDQTEVILKSNMDLGLDVRILENEDGSICINAEDTAIGFGWTQTQNKKGKQYISIRWETLNSYCNELGFPNILGKDDYIPESLFYRLGMKASNEKAQKFQGWLADEVIPDIRRTGGYAYSGLSTEMKALLMHDKKLQVVDTRLTNLENNMTLDHGQQQTLNEMINRKVVMTLGGKGTMAYKLLSKKTFPEVYRALKNTFQVPSYRDIPVKQFEKAKELVNLWKPSADLNLMIIGANAQVTLNE